MLKFFQSRFALSEKGAKDFSKGILFSTIHNMALMFPAVFMFFFLEDYIRLLEKTQWTAVNGFYYYIILAFLLMLTMYVIARFQYRKTFTVTYNESAIRRIHLAEKLRKLPLAFFGEKNLSDLTSTIMDDSTQLEHTFSHAVPQLFASIISVSLIAIGLFFFNWRLSLALFWVVPIAAAIIVFSKNKLHKDNLELYHIKRGVTEQIQECLETIQEIKSYNGQEEYVDRLDRNLNLYEKSLIKGELITGVLLNCSQSVLKLGLASVIIVGANLLMTGTIDTFIYLIFLVIASTIYNPISEVFNNMAVLKYLDIRINRMKEMDSMPIQIGNTNYKLDNYDIEFKNVDFSYEKDKQVIKNASFIAKQGETTALIGPSGGGKSTLAKLAARFWDIDKGIITLGGKDISKIEPEALLKNYSVVFQEVVLFNASVMDNIRVGKHDATDEEVMKVSQLAQCDEFIKNLPRGYDTVIGENGQTLSGGERQRISIARALLKDAPIVLLDEATASLDVENETNIQAGISELIKDKTVLIIAHRMRTIANVDKIVAIKEGQITEIGSPSVLKKQGGFFAQMVKIQSET